jgi:hypothetical protein
MQDTPFGMVMMIVQVLPSLLVSTSTIPPLLASPRATGASAYSDERRLITASRGVHCG